MSIPSDQTTQLIKNLREEFRIHLEGLYAYLHLAPPYHSIEKAIQLLANTLTTKPIDFLQALIDSSPLKWGLFREIYQSSGLAQKHRGIISNFLTTRPLTDMPEEVIQLLEEHSEILTRSMKIAAKPKTK